LKFYRSSSDGIRNVQLHVLMMERQKENKRIYTHQQEKHKKKQMQPLTSCFPIALTLKLALFPKERAEAEVRLINATESRSAHQKTDQTQLFRHALSLSFSLSPPSRLRYKNEAKCKTNGRINKNPPERPRHPTFPNKSDKIVPSCHFFYCRPSLAACALLPQSKEFCFSNNVKETKIKEQTCQAGGVSDE
jgi:hypothetical protein